MQTFSINSRSEMSTSKLGILGLLEQKPRRRRLGEPSLRGAAAPVLGVLLVELYMEKEKEGKREGKELATWCILSPKLMEA